MGRRLMAVATSDKVTESIRKEASPLSGEVDDYNQLLAVIGNAHFCLLGASPRSVLSLQTEEP